ncbi:MAG: hypothetical protein K8L99_34715 [Anaerolineae bacterium]|nr:hypothetical protein [Anaerolineae bacterium]
MSHLNWLEYEQFQHRHQRLMRQAELNRASARAKLRLPRWKHEVGQILINLGKQLQQHENTLQTGTV